MNQAPISSPDLERFILGEDLDEATRASIASAILIDPRLRARHDRLAALLHVAAEHVVSGSEPDAGFEDRLWKRVSTQLPRPTVAAPRRRWPAWALAACVLAAVGTGVLLRVVAPPPASLAIVPSGAPGALLANDARDRMLEHHLAEYFAAAGHALQPQQRATPEVRSVAGALARSNRIYTLAAERRQRVGEARLLRELRPALDQLAGGDLTHSDSESTERLAFQARSLASRMRRSPITAEQRG